MFRCLAIAGMLVLASLAIPGAVSATNGTVCTGTINGGTIGSLTAPASVWCVLKGVTVEGTVTVEANGSFTAYNSTIKKHVFGRDAERVRLIDTDIYGQIHISGTTGPVAIGSSGCALDPYAGGNIHLFDNHGYVGVCDMTIRNNLIVQGNDGGAHGFVTLTDNKVGNNIIVHKNVQQAIVVNRNTVDNNIQVSQNTVDPEDIRVVGNDIDGNLICHGNVGPLVVSGNSYKKALGQC